MLGEFLHENSPDVSVQVVIKSNEDWGEYIDSVGDNFKFLTVLLTFLRCFHDYRSVALMASTAGPAHSCTPWRAS